MNESTNLTPKEQFHASLYRDPKKMFRNHLFRKLLCIIPSVGLMIGWYFTRDMGYLVVGYGILLFDEVRGIVLAKIGIATGSRIYEKYDEKLGAKPNSGSNKPLGF